MHVTLAGVSVVLSIMSHKHHVTINNILSRRKSLLKITM